MNDSIKFINDNSFKDCILLEEIVMSKNIEFIGKSAFQNSTIKKIFIPKNVTYIRDFTFKDCSELEEVYFEGNIKHIGKEAFMNCRKLKKININSNSIIEFIDETSFQNCNSLMNFI